MSNVIDFLERLGNDAQLNRASDALLEQALNEAQIDPAVREAILLRDQRQLETLLGADSNVCCMIIAPAREDDASEEQRTPQDEPAQEEKAIQRSAG
jgi:hypothetical protein